VKTEPRIILYAATAGALYWLLDGVLDTLFFYDDSFLDLLILDVPFHKVSMRLVVFGLFLLFGGFVASLIAERERSQERTQHLQAVLEGIRNVNQLVTKESDPEVLIEKACKNLTKTLGYHAAFLVLVDEKGGVIHAAGSGKDGHLEKLRQHLESGSPIPCIKSEKDGFYLRVCENPAVECQERPISASYEGLAAFSSPLIFQGRCFGYLTVSVPLRFACDPREKSLFLELVNDLAFAIYEIEIAERTQKNDAQLRRAHEIARLGAWQFNLKNNVVHASDEARKLYGLGDREWTIDEIKSIPLAKYRRQLDRALADLVSGEAPYDEEFIIRRPTDQKLIHIRSMAEYDRNKNLIIGTIQDITSQKEIRLELEQEKERLEAILENIPAMIAFFDPAGKPQWINHFYEKALGYELEEAQEPGFFEKLFPDADYRERVLAFIEAAKGEWDDFQIHTKSGKLLETAWANIPLSDGSNIGIGIDVTERRKAETGLKESQRQLSTLMSNLPGMVFRCLNKPGWPMVFVSHGCEELSGLTSGELTSPDGVSYESLIDSKDQQHVWDTVQQAIGKGESFTLEYRIRDKSGQEHWVWEQGRLVSEDEEGIGILEGFVSDITEGKRAEQERARLQEQLNQSQKMEAVGRLAGGIAHDFNNILQGILGFSQMLVQNLEKEPDIGFAKEILSGAERASSLTRQLLAFSRRQVLEPRPLNLNEVIENLLKLIRRTIGENISLEFRPGQDIGTIYADVGQVEQVLMNLCVNARDSMPRGGKLIIDTKAQLFGEDYVSSHPWAEPGNYVIMEVSDNGSGMDKKTREQIFTPFFTTKEVGKGTGLGLATVYGIIKQHRGIVNVYSEVGEGTTFKICFPELKGAAAENVRRKSEEDALPLPGGQETILLAEDDGTVRNLGVHLLKEFGYHVIEARNGQEAIDILNKRSGEIDLALLDMVMPKRGGREVSDHFRLLKANAKIIFVSGYSAETVHTDAVLGSSVGFVQKPYSKETLLRKIRKVLDE